MRHKMLVRLVAWLQLITYLSAPIAQADQLALPMDDFDAPKIIHQPITGKLPSGSVQRIQATVTDNVGIKSVVLFYRPMGARHFQRAIMQSTANADQYEVELNEALVVAPGIEYYIEATDLAGNRLLQGHTLSPLIITVVDTVSPIAQESIAGESQAQSEPVISSKKSYTWLWVTLGVLAVAGLASGGGSGDGSDSGTKPEGDTGTISVTTPLPGP